MSGGRISVIVAGDDGGSRSSILRALEGDGDIAVVAQLGSALAPRAAGLLRPDLLALDLGGGPGAVDAGLGVIDQVMAHSPVPILVLHPAAAGEARIPLEVIAAGALECLARPPAWGEENARKLRDRVRVLRRVPVIRHTRGRLLGADAGVPVVGMAASTGGPAALAAVLGGLRGLGAAVLVVQHIDERFLDGFVEVLRRGSALPVELAAEGAPLRAGRVLVAPAGVHLAVGRGRRVVLTADPPSLHRPSADVLFGSLARHAGAAGIGVVLTGMGDDGAAGLVALRQSGGSVVAQDASTCAVFGMPRAALARGAVDRLTMLGQIPARVRAAVAAVPR